MNMKEVYQPIEEQLRMVDNELLQILQNDSGIFKDSIDEIFNHFFKNPGKRLRPALTLLSAGMINNNLPRQTNDKLIKLAVILELIHSTSLIHDDIIDDDTLRRGQKTLNGIYGRKIAVLAGDILYAKTYALLTDEMPRYFVKSIIKLTEDMCRAEVEQAKTSDNSMERYFAIVRGKTAEFMAVCCKLGGMIAGADREKSELLAEFGLNLGMSYQLIDDITDGDIDRSLNIKSKDAERFAYRALNALNAFDDSSYKDSLKDFVGFILNLGKSEPKNIKGVITL